ncbi:MAG: hypothetical protein Q8O37_09545 [Sulfuricellaceae bacterium]|nr:hypothetical protein [Sulfuricellaceae bacterium]
MKTILPADHHDACFRRTGNAARYGATIMEIGYPASNGAHWSLKDV